MLSATAIAGCWQDSPFDPSGGERALTIEDPVLLAERVEYFEDPLTVEPLASVLEPELAPLLSLAQSALTFPMTLIAEVDPPTLEGTPLQATHLAIRGDRAYVSYNVQGSVFLGGVDAFDRIGGKRPILTSGLLFTDTDVSAVEADGNELYLATGAAETSYDSTAVFETTGLRAGGRLISPLTTRMGVPSFVATGLALQGTRIFLTSGDTGGGVTVLDQSTLAVLSFDPFEDARAVAAEGGRVVALRGTPAALRSYDPSSGALLAEIPVGGATIPEAKSGLALAGDVAAVAAGEAGVKLVHLGSEAVIAELPLPVQGDPDFVSNEVAIHGDVLFVANGGGGLWAAESSIPLGAIGPGDSPVLQWIGRVGFPEGTSVNFVARKGNRLVTAGGLGGLKIVALDG